MPRCRRESRESRLLRGVAALAVVTFHWWVFHDRQLEWADPAGYGWLGVQLFFAISGFVLFLPYARGDKRLDLPSFIAGRFVRIVPAWWAAVVIGGIVTGTAWTWGNAGELVFLQMWWEPATDPVPQGWTLCAEAGFYVVMPIVVVATARYRPLQLPILLALVPLGWVALMELYHGLGIFTPLTWLDQFAWGMVAASVVARGIRVPGWVAMLAAAGGVWVMADVPRHVESPYGWPSANVAAACVRGDRRMARDFPFHRTARGYLARDRKLRRLPLAFSPARARRWRMALGAAGSGGAHPGAARISGTWMGVMAADRTTGASATSAAHSIRQKSLVPRSGQKSSTPRRLRKPRRPELVRFSRLVRPRASTEF